MNPYESDKLLAEYLLFHYGTAEEILGGGSGPRDALGFAVRSVTELLAPVPEGARALDLGCAVGRSSFELARHCAAVLGIDYSRAFIGAASDLRRDGSRDFTALVEGEITEPRTARVPDEIDRSRVAFEPGDAMDLRADLDGFDVVLGANLICRLPEPRRFLARVKDLVRPGGQLLLTTPFTWMAEFTPRENWLGGTPGVRSFDALRAELEPHFSLEHQADLPFLIREHVRKFQYGIALGTRWRRLEGNPAAAGSFPTNYGQ